MIQFEQLRSGLKKIKRGVKNKLPQMSNHDPIREIIREQDAKSKAKMKHENNF